MHICGEGVEAFGETPALRRGLEVHICGAEAFGGTPALADLVQLVQLGSLGTPPCMARPSQGEGGQGQRDAERAQFPPGAPRSIVPACVDTNGQV
jgi:hypothetical protein